MADQMIYSLEDSTLISYAEHLETDETLRTELSKQWNTISLIYHGIILYGILVLAMGAATVVFVMRWRKEKKNAKSAEKSVADE